MRYGMVYEVSAVLGDLPGAKTSAIQSKMSHSGSLAETRIPSCRVGLHGAKWRPANPPNQAWSHSRVASTPFHIRERLTRPACTRAMISPGERKTWDDLPPAG